MELKQIFKTISQKRTTFLSNAIPFEYKNFNPFSAEIDLRRQNL